MLSHSCNSIIFLAAIALLLACTFTSSSSVKPKHELPFPFNVKSPFLRFASHRGAPKNKSYPVWPNAFNATLSKLDPESNMPLYTKLHYDFPYSRFYFYEHYYNMNNTWGESTYEVLFVPDPYVFYHIYPQERKCDISPSRIPTISPHWLQLTEFKGMKEIRGLFCEEWEFPKDLPSVGGMKYYTRDVLTGLGIESSTDIDTRVPIRSRNQDEDPGVTDFSDFQIGSQDKRHWVVPDYCPPVESLKDRRW